MTYDHCTTERKIEMNLKSSRHIRPRLLTIAALTIAVLLAALLLGSLSGCSVRTRTQISEYTDTDRTLKSPSSYTDLYKTIKRHRPRNSHPFSCGGTGNLYAVAEEAAEHSLEDAGAVETIAASENISATEYSDTNVRTSGVLEGDIVKTDGRYLYTVSPENGIFTIIDTDGKMSVVYSGQILGGDEFKCHEFFVMGDQLFFTGYREQFTYKTTDERGSWAGCSFLLTFDISDRSDPKLTDTYTQSGQYLSCRIADGYFYLFTNYSESKPKKNSIPLFNEEPVACEDIYYGRYFDAANYYCLGGIDLADPGTCKSAKAVLSTGSDFYVSDSSIFVVSADWVTLPDRNYNATDIVSIGYENGMLTGKAIGSVPGLINDSFSIDAYNGCLRLVTTEWEQKNPRRGIIFRITGRDSVPYEAPQEVCSLWILDEDMNLLSSLRNIQEDEHVESARFLGDTVYFVTFRQTDPLFAADLSDPYAPKMLGGIQLNGFSNYLHKWSDNLLLGIGYDADSNGVITGGKISMFDTSDPAAIREIDRNIFGENITTLGSDYSYKNVLVDPEKNLIGFAAQRYSYQPDIAFDGDDGVYYVFSYDPEKGFTKELEVKLFEENYWYDYREDLIIDDSEFYDEGAIEEEEPVPETETPVSVEPDSALSETDAVQSVEPDGVLSETDADASYSIFKELNDVLAERDLSEREAELPEELPYIYKNVATVRGLYINDNLYIVHPGVGIYKYNLDTGKHTDTLVLYQPEDSD